MNAQLYWHEVKATLQKTWGYDDFRSPQGEIVQTLLAQKDAFIIMPTGGGKSICFQLPALLQTGLTLVVSPLVALMENQVKELLERGIPAALLHSQLSSGQRKQTLRKIEQQQLKLLYLSPETLLSLPVWQRLCQPNLKISTLALDEAHCLTQWGETFRPAYTRLGAVRPALLKHKPPGTRITLAAFTATADPQAQQTIQRILHLQQPQVFLHSPYRSNLHLSIQIAWTPRGRRQQLLQFIQARPKQAGLIYVRTRRNAETLAEWLAQQGYKTAAYHAGLNPEERRDIETAWLSGVVLFVICTSAFGMGINKPDVRWIIHFHAPLLLTEYIQEVGRAGRDGKLAEALTLISEPTGWLDPEDRQRQQFFQNQLQKQQLAAQQLIHKLPPQGEISAITQQFPNAAIALAILQSAGKLNWQDPFHYIINSSPPKQAPNQAHSAQQMPQYLHTKTCRWQFLLQAFGFAQAAESLKKGCGHCDHCKH